MREGVAQLICSQTDMVLVGRAASVEAALFAYAGCLPDITILDSRLANGEGLLGLRLLLDEHPDARVIVMTTYDHDLNVDAILDAGARAVLLKATLRHELLPLIRRVRAGE
ncbi:hypothetical protein TBR22_A42660 [Luteitalea sp. TBR-22]|nr:hypothetical protein TBR22_A42660 [Luteitalea sp. TBR-22]